MSVSTEQAVTATMAVFDPVQGIRRVKVFISSLLVKHIY